ncbi:mannitol dehydrogenase family protein [Microbacterium sp. NPDC057650]|uniref:mannitol dehydrogenase family protein n=1 Tax=unclassified Microbacterium TaxID=2609290 RepID=UPI00366B0540
MRLSRALLAKRGTPAPAAPVRIAHLGLGAFHRAHQAWYTANAADGADWGIAAVAGRSGELPALLRPQDGLYTLVERGPEGDRFEVVSSISTVNAADEHVAFRRVMSAAGTGVVTITVTEAGYAVAPSGGLDLSAPGVASDAARLRALSIDARPTTMLGRLALGLELRRLSGAGPIAVVPCDNLPANGAVLRDVLTEFTEHALPALARDMPQLACFVSTSVDRITPRVSDTLAAEVQEATGWTDAAPVAAEPFSDWTLCGEFPAGRPEWESAGALFVDDAEPYELRKLWLLNGAHSILACLGLLRGRTTIAEAIADRECAASVEAWWDDATRNLDRSLRIEEYRAALLQRFRNPRIEHRLEQISRDGLTKIAVRIVPVALRERHAGRTADGAAQAIAAWIVAAEAGILGADARASETERALREGDHVAAMLAALDPRLAADAELTARVREHARRLSPV